MITNRQAALIGGVSGTLLVIAIATTLSVVWRHAEVVPVQSDTPTTTVPVVVPTSTVATSSTSGASTSTTSTTPSNVVRSDHYLVGDIATGEVRASRRSTESWPLASLTKLMTAVVATDLIAEETTITIVSVPGGNPSKPVLPTGTVLTRDDVLAIMLVASSNEAAESLAAHIGRETFIAAMNTQAARWGLGTMTFVDPTGLGAGNRGTARDVFDMTQHIWDEYPHVFTYTRQGQQTVYAQGSGIPYTGYATHQLVRTPGFVGGKTGYTDEARGNLLSIFQQGTQYTAFVVLGSDDRFGDTRRLLTTQTTRP